MTNTSRTPPLRAGTVHAIHAWEYPTTYGDGWIPDGDEFATNAAHVLDHPGAADRAASG